MMVPRLACRAKARSVRIICSRVLATCIALCPVGIVRDANASDAAQPNSSSTGTGGADSTQSFVSPLGLGSGATIAVMQKGATAAASIEQQLTASWVNFWQLGLSGATNTNGQAAVYSSTDTGAPGFKGKLGFGHSSFQATDTRAYTAAGRRLKGEVWCINVAAKLAGLSLARSDAARYTSCKPMIDAAMATLAALPSGVDAKSAATKVDVLKDLQAALFDEAAAEDRICKTLKAASAEAYNACPDSGAIDLSVEDLGQIYPTLYSQIVQVAALPALYYKLSLNWSPTLVSTDYRSVVNGVPNLATNEHWSRVLNAVAMDASVYYKAWSFGLETAYGKTVSIVEQNVCNTTTSGTFTAQQCKNAMIGEPDPMNTASVTGAISFTPAANSKTAALIRPGFEAVAYFERPSGTDGHKTQISLPLYMAPISAPLKFVIGLEPIWTWNTEPKQKNDFSVVLFVGARPNVPN
jgi:hypothetical protein